ncbi:Aldehyde/histidinol dehydrogenase [Catenaria anguillulae PL171]|uniref:Aldehyde/histidinol dehydrogenase n=1 Tax=Catenaria anguillulae PL171 TaxID=765915 RepID=A0A1Y2HA63_9FUNG|nr:Aldehyde/histidinol dehydrogenase [Catenaria anguillulae PL171]
MATRSSPPASPTPSDSSAHSATTLAGNSCPAAALCEGKLDPATGRPWNALDIAVPTTLTTTPIPAIQPLVQTIRANWTRTRALHSLSFRKQQLRQLAKLMNENEDLLCAALYHDLHKSRYQTQFSEFFTTTTEIAEAVKHLDAWAKPEYPSRQLVNLTDTVMVRKDPVGVVLVIGAWNYPLYLTLSPMVAAIAAGNAVVLKPSEVSPHTAQVLADLIPKYLDPRFFQVVNGGVPETSEVLKAKFDHILYTGNGSVARIIMSAAAKHLTPVTLELGGKSPAVIHPSADLRNAARRIVFGKFINCGQTCVAPDYILISRDQQDEFVRELQAAITEMYGADPKDSPDYGRIVADRHFDRLAGYIKSFDKPHPAQDDLAGQATYGGQIAIGGSPAATWTKADRYIPPTVLTNVGIDSPIMEDEIFGPLLPIVPLDTPSDATADADLADDEWGNNRGADAFMRQAASLIGRRDHPLALYVFGRDAAACEWLVAHTQSGGVTVNDTIMHLVTAGLPFGGVGGSGIGAYHGKFGFDAMTHKRAVLKRAMGLEFVNSVRYAPLGETQLSLAKRFVFSNL